MVDDAQWFIANKVIDDRARPGDYRSGRDHPLYGIPRDSRGLLSTIFICDCCEHKMHAEGRNEGGYRCSNARKGGCWNKATCLRNPTHERIGEAVTSAILRTTPDVIDVLVSQVEKLLSDRGSLIPEQKDLAKRRKQLQCDQQRLLNFIKSQDESPEFVKAELSKVTDAEKQLCIEEQILQSRLAARISSAKLTETLACCLEGEPIG